MQTLSKILIALIASLHWYIAWFEMFAWTTKGPKIFSSFPADLFEQTLAMAANQGLYNGFLAAGLVWALLIKDQAWSRNVALCFLTFVAIAGIFGAFTVTQKIIFIQTVPAVIAMICVILAGRKSTVSA